MHVRETRPANAIERNAHQHGDYLEAPPGSEEFAAEWNAIVHSFPSDFFRPCDVAVLTERVLCALELRSVQQTIATLDSRYVRNGAGTLVPHPALKDQELLRARLRALSTQTRTSPGARLEGKQQPPKKPMGTNHPLASVLA